MIHSIARVAVLVPILALAPDLAWGDSCVLEGRVTLDDGSGVAAVAVTFEPGSTSAVTDAQGDFVLRGLPCGSGKAAARLSGFAESSADVELAADRPGRLELTIRPLRTTLDEITVSSAYSISRSDPTSTVAISRQEVAELPTFANDLYRAVTLLPGTSGNDISSAFTVRGGAHREVLVRLDGIELFEPFHMKDFAGALSILDPEVVDTLDLYPGGFPAEFGDRSTGVLDMTTTRPSARAGLLGIGFSSAQVGAAGVFDSGDGGWQISARRGWLDLVFDLVGEDDEEEEEGDGGAPEYWDLYGKLAWDASPRSTWTLSTLAADDRYAENEREDGVLEIADTSYGNTRLALSHQWLLDDSLLDSRLFALRVDRDRRAEEAQSETAFLLRDERTLDVLGLASDWSRQLGPDHLLSAGLELRRYEALYDYRNQRAFTDPIAGIGDVPQLAEYAATVEGDQVGVYVSDLWRVGSRLAAEAGLRWDQQDWTDDDQVSPRLNAVADLGRFGVVRASWGYAHQSQRPNELAVEDADLAFYPAERSEQIQLGWEKQLGSLATRLDLYSRVTDDPLPRYENLFDPFNPFPEGSPDRVRIAPDKARARGVELLLNQRVSERWRWWLSYSLSEVEDRLEGRWTPRSIDQRHALTLSGNWRFGNGWNLNAAWIYHTGWPTTRVTAALQPDGVGGLTVVPELGPINGENLDDYHRLDLRVGKVWRLDRGELDVFIDVQNLYDRDNQQGFGFGSDAFIVEADGSVTVSPEEETWLGVLPTFGVTWRF